MAVHKFYIVQVIKQVTRNPFLVIEKMQTVDGFRDRITNISFSSLPEAEAWLKEHQDGGQ